MIKSRHILHDFDAALDSLRADVLMMASLTDRNLQNAMTSLLDRDPQLCVITISDEQEINSLEKTVDQNGFELLLRYQPVASDLRQVVSAMKLSSNLERIGDQAVKIARRSRNLSMEPELDEAGTLGSMFIEAIGLFRDSVRAYADGDLTLARSLRARDREIDQMNLNIADNLTIGMGQHPDRIPDYLNLLLIARHLERVGDHAKNIGEEAIYSTAAEDVRHLENTLYQ